MATITLFDALPLDLWNERHNASDTYKVAIFPSSTAMAASDASHGYADYAGELTGGSVPSGGLTLDNFTVTNTSVDFDDEVIAANVSNPTTGQKFLIYNDTVTGKYGLGFVDFGSAQDLVNGGTIQPASGGFITQSA